MQRESVVLPIIINAVASSSQLIQIHVNRIDSIFFSHLFFKILKILVE